MKKILTDSNDGTLVYNNRAVVSDIPVTTSGTSLILPQTIAAKAKPVNALKRYGLCTQASTPTPSTPVDILCNTGAVHEGLLGEYTYDQIEPDDGNESTAVPPGMPFSKLFVAQKNLFPSDWIEQGSIAAADGHLVPSPARVRTRDFIPIKPSQEYTISEQGATYTFAFFYKKDGSFISSSGSWKNTPYAFTTPATAYKIKFTFANSTGTGVNITPDEVSDVQLEEGASATTYSQPPYMTDIAPLLSNSDGTVRDEQNVMTGVITRNVGYTVLTGNETWRYTSSGGCFYAIIPTMKKNNPRIAGFSTHFVGSAAINTSMPDNSIAFADSGDNGIIVVKCTACTSMDAWETWLTAQYEAGTPVIVVYERAESITEVMDKGTLSTFEGSNTVESLSAVDAKIDITYVTG